MSDSFYGVQIIIGEDEFKLYGECTVIGTAVYFKLNWNECKCRGAGGSEWSYLPKINICYLSEKYNSLISHEILKWIEEH